MITRRGFFKSVGAGLAALMLPRKSEAGAKVGTRRSGTEFICAMPEGCERPCTFNNIIYTYNDNAVYYFDGSEFIHILQNTKQQTYISD